MSVTTAPPVLDRSDKTILFGGLGLVVLLVALADCLVRVLGSGGAVGVLFACGTGSILRGRVCDRRLRYLASRILVSRLVGSVRSGVSAGRLCEFGVDYAVWIHTFDGRYAGLGLGRVCLRCIRLDLRLGWRGLGRLNLGLGLGQLSGVR